MHIINICETQVKHTKRVAVYIYIGRWLTNYIFSVGMLHKAVCWWDENSDDSILLQLFTPEVLDCGQHNCASQLW